ncbi:hypothetical protein MMC25_005666 [Agyrium rufum]|nr:hypothetical protein [Agyrium rufum]
MKRRADDELEEGLIRSGRMVNGTQFTSTNLVSDADRQANYIGPTGRKLAALPKRDQVLKPEPVNNNQKQEEQQLPLERQSSDSSGLLQNSQASSQPQLTMFGGNKPGGLSINTGSANALGSTSTQSGGLFGAAKPAGGSLFGSLGGASQSGTTTGLFGTSNNAGQQTQGGGGGGGLFGSTGTSTAQTSNPFGIAVTSSQPGGSLFGTSTNTGSSGGGLFGNQTAANPAPSGGLFGNSTTAASAPAGGGLFGTSTNNAAGGSLFGNTAAKPATSSLFGNPSNVQQQQQQQPQQQQQQQQQQSTQGGGFFGMQSNNNQASSLFPPTQTNQSLGASLLQSQQASQPRSLFSSSIGQYTRDQQPVPGVRIDVSNVRPTTRYNDLHEDLQKGIETVDHFILSQIRFAEECEQALPLVENVGAILPPDYEFCARKYETWLHAIEGDAVAIEEARKLIRKDVTHSRMCFKAIQGLRMPQQLHSSSFWNASSAGVSQGAAFRLADDESDPNGNETNLVLYFSRAADEMDNTLEEYKRNLTAVEDYLSMVDSTMTQELTRQSFARGSDGRERSAEDQTAELAAVFREFDHGILAVARKILDVREQAVSVVHGNERGNANGNGFGYDERSRYSRY